MSCSRYVPPGSAGVARFQDFAPNYGEFWRQCAMCGWWDWMGNIYAVLYIIEFTHLDMFLCDHCRLSWGSRSPSSPSSTSSYTTSESSLVSDRRDLGEAFGLSISSAKFDRRVQAMFEDLEPLNQDYEAHLLMCRWCGWWDQSIDDITNVHKMREVENYPCLSRCSWCQQFDEPPWWPNNRQRYA